MVWGFVVWSKILGAQCGDHNGSCFLSRALKFVEDVKVCIKFAQSGGLPETWQLLQNRGSDGGGVGSGQSGIC